MCLGFKNMVDLKRPGRRVLVGAHRGARSLAPENTLAAALKAHQIGSDFWELDVQMTADGELVVIHDDNLKRTSNAETVLPDRAPWSVHEFTLAEFRRLDFGSWFLKTDPFGQLAAGAVAAKEAEGYRGIPAPTLREALEFTRERRWRVNVEIKNLAGKPGHEKIVGRVLDLISELTMDEDVLISSFNHDYLRQVRAARPAMCTGVLVSARNAPADPAPLMAELKAHAYHPPFQAVEPQRAAALIRAGMPINVWTVNETADLSAFVAAGVSSIITDFPQRLKTLL